MWWYGSPSPITVSDGSPPGVTPRTLEQFYYKEGHSEHSLLVYSKITIFFLKTRFLHVLWHWESENAKNYLGPSVQSAIEFYLFFYTTNFSSINGVLIGSGSTLIWRHWVCPPKITPELGKTFCPKTNVVFSHFFYKSDFQSCNVKWLI